MSEKDEMMKVANDARVELTDDDVDQVAGGYSKETWEKMTPDERKRAYQESKAYRTLGMYCAYDDKSL